MNLVIPYTFAAKTKAKAAEVNANFAAVATVINGGLTDANFAVLADLDANKLSSTSGKRVSAAKMENNAVDARVLANDPASPGTDAGRAVTGAHVRTLTVADIARIVPASSIANSMLIGPITAFIGAASIGEDKLKITSNAVANSTAGVAGASAATVVSAPSVNFPVATYDCLGVFLRATGFATLIGSPFADNSGTNWSGGVRWANPTGAPAAGSGTLVYVFISKT